MKPDARLKWKTRVFAMIVILSNAFGNFFLDRGMHGRVTTTPFEYVAAILTPWVMLGISLLILWLLSPHGPAQLGRPELRSAGDQPRLRRKHLDRAFSF